MVKVLLFPYGEELTVNDAIIYELEGESSSDYHSEIVHCFSGKYDESLLNEDFVLIMPRFPESYQTNLYGILGNFIVAKKKDDELVSMIPEDIKYIKNNLEELVK